MRLKLGQRIHDQARTIAAAPAPTAPVVPTGPSGSPAPKLDVDPIIASIDLGAEPIPIRITVPAYDLATHNSLVALSVVFMPTGGVEPIDPGGWITSGYPKATATTQAPPPPTAPIAASGAPADGSPAPAMPVGMTAAPVVTTASPAISGQVLSPPHTAVAHATVIVRAATTLPGPEGGDVELMIPGTPNGMFEVQIILGFDA